jgi:toxin YoeB
MSFEIVFTQEALSGMKKLKKIGDKSLLNKFYKLVQELRVHPETGTGKPERLRGNLSGLWSRRINREHRLVYFIEGKTVTVTIVSVYGHYE